MRQACLSLGVQQGALLQAEVQQTHLPGSVAADDVGVVVEAQQQAAEQGGRLEAGGLLAAQHRCGGEQLDGLQGPVHSRTVRHTLRTWTS